MVYSKILEEVKNEWSTDEIVIYLLYRICQESYYDVRVKYLGDDIDLHRKIYYGYKDIDKDEDNRIVCNTGVRILHDLLERLGIYSEIVYSSKDDGAELIYKDENGNYKFVNLITNLLSCKLDLLPRSIGLGKKQIQNYEIDKPITEIHFEDLKKMCEKLQICKRSDWEDLLEALRKKLKNNNSFRGYLKEISQNDEERMKSIDNMSNYDILEEKLDFISKYIPCEIKNAGPSEIQQFYMWLIWGNTLNRNERKSGAIMKNYFKRIGDEVDVINVIQKTDKDGISKYYIYSSDLKTYKKMASVEEFIKNISGYELFENRISRNSRDEQ